MKHFAENVINQAGVPVAGAAVTVFVTGTQNQPVIYSDDGITLKANPITTDALGRFDFYVADGRYDLAVTGPTLLPFTLSNIEIADLTEAQTADAIWNTEAIRFANQGAIPGTPPAGNVNIYTKALDKRLYYKDDTGTEIGPLVPGGTTSPVNAPSPFLFNTDMEFKGPNPYVDIRNFGARAVNPNVTPQIPGITANTINGQAQVTLSSASTFQTGDGVIIFGAGPVHGMPTPAAPTVTPSLAVSGTCTGCPTTPSATGSNTYNYTIVARDKNGGLTAPSPVASIATGQPVLGNNNVNISTFSRSAQVVTVTTATAHPIQVGCAFAACGEVFIGGGNGLSDVTFRGWFTVISAVDSTHFTFNGPPNTVLGASTSATGGTATFYASNHVTFAQVPGAVQYLLCSDRNSPGTFAPIGLSNPSTAGNPDLVIEDFGSPMEDNKAFPALYTGACTATGPTSDGLITTILAGAGTTTLTLANAAGTTISNTPILFTNGPAFVAAAGSVSGIGYGSVTIPAIAGSPTNSFVINNWTTLPTGVAVSQIGPLYLNDTLEVLATGNGGAKWRGDSFPQFGFGLPVSCWSSNPGITVNTAHPGLLFSGSQFSMDFSNTQVTTPVQNGTLGVLVEGGFNQRVDHVCLSMGTGGNDYLSQGIQFRASVGQANSNVALNFVGFSPGGGSDGVSHAPTAHFRGSGTVDVHHSFSAHRGMLYTGNATIHLGVGDVAYINGGGTPLLTLGSSQATAVVGTVQLDTIAQPCVAGLHGNNNFPLVIFQNGMCTPSSSVLGVSGYFSSIIGGNNPALANAIQSPLTAPSPSESFFNTLSGGGVQDNANRILGGNASLFTRKAPLAAPTCVVSAGGSLAVGSYTFQVAEDWITGTSIASPSSGVCTTTPGNQTITVSWAASTGGPIGYEIYTNGLKFRQTSGVGNSCVTPFIPGGGTTTWVLSSALTNCGTQPLTVPTGGPTTLGTGVTGISTPLLTLGGFGVTAPAAGPLAVSAGGIAAGNLAKYSTTGGVLVDSGVAASSLATVPLAVGNISPGTNGQCVNTSGSAAVWGSCAGTAGEQLLSTNTNPVTVSANTAGFQTLQAAGATISAGALNALGKTFRFEAYGTFSPVNNSEIVQLQVISTPSNPISSGTLVSYVPGTANQTYNWKLKALCTTTATGSNGTATCAFEQYTAFAGINSVAVASSTAALTNINWTAAFTPATQIAFGTASASNTATGSYFVVEQLN